MELPLELGMPPLHVSCPQRPGRPTTQTKEASTTYLMDTVVFFAGFECDHFTLKLSQVPIGKSCSKHSMLVMLQLETAWASVPQYAYLVTWSFCFVTFLDQILCLSAEPGLFPHSHSLKSQFFWLESQFFLGSIPVFDGQIIMFGRSITIFVAQILSNGGYMGKKTLAGTSLPKSAGLGWQRGLGASGANWDLMWRKIHG